MKVFAILVVLVTLAAALPRSDEDEFGDWKFGGLEEELQGEIATVDEDAGSGGEVEFYYDNPAMVEPVEPSGQINVDGKIEHGVWYNVDTITDLGYAYDVAKDIPCCEACKNLYEDTEFFEIHRETMSDYFYKQCACVKSKPGVVPSTYSMASLSGKCGLWEYNGGVDLGKERLFVSSSTHFLGSTNNVSDASDCCDACMDKFPDTQLFIFFDQFKEEKFCLCKKTKNDTVPATWEKVYGIGTCDGPVEVATEIPAAGTVDYPMAEIEDYDYNYNYNYTMAEIEDYDYNYNYNYTMAEIEDYDYNYNFTTFKLTREFLVRGVMDSFEAYYDTNPKDGNLTKEEFETAIQSDAQSTNLTWEDLLKLLDENCDGAIIDLEFRGLANISFETMSLDKDKNFYITQEELGDDKLWKTLLDQHADKDGRVDVDEYYKFMINRQLENDRCPARPAPPSADPLVVSDESLDKLFDDDGGKSLNKLFDDDGGDLDDGLDKIIVTLYRVRAAGEKTYYKETVDGEMELI